MVFASGAQGFAKSKYEFDKNGRLDKLTHTKVAGNVTLAGYDLSYDRVSRVKAMDFLVSAHNNEDVLSFAYNPRNELTNVTRPTQTPSKNEAYGYDTNGNRTSSTSFATSANYQLISTSNNDNRILKDGQFQYTYDPEGNITQRTQLVGGNPTGLTTIYTWDHRNRLAKVEEKPSVGGTVTKWVEYRYDAFNQLVGRIVDPDGATGNAPWQETWFIHDEGQIVLQLEATGSANETVTHRYLWGPAVDQILADVRVSVVGQPGTVEWALGDNLGTVRDWLSSSGNVVEHLVYDSFGRIIHDSDPTVDHVFAFTGRFFDPHTGLQNNLHRWYDPHQGRWLSEDPIGFAAGDANLYRYVGNSPTNAVDPTGWIAFELKTGRPPSAYDDVWQRVEASYKSRRVTLEVMHYLVMPVRTMTQDAIGIGFAAKGLRIPAQFLAHYATNVGGKIKADVADMVSRDFGVRTSARTLISEAVKFADQNLEAIQTGGGGFRSEMTYETATIQDYFLSIKDFGAWIEGTNVTCVDGRIKVELSYQIDDVYDFDINSKDGVGKILWGNHLLKDADLAAMHEYGQMRAFRIEGNLKVTATWIRGNFGSVKIEGLPDRKLEDPYDAPGR